MKTNPIKAAPKLATQNHTSLTGIPHKGPLDHCGVCNFEGPRAFCLCGHFGDLRLNDPHPEPVMHRGVLGHGACINCKCEKFSWKKWTSRFNDAMEKFVVRG